jgi:hypothetical protein
MEIRSFTYNACKLTRFPISRGISPDNLRVETWIEFVRVVSHPHVKLVISQCGVATTHESILSQVPLLCMPIIYDQFDISVLVKYRQTGEMLLSDGWNVETIYQTVVNMMDNEMYYRENSGQLLNLARKKPSISSVVDWIETVDQLGKEYFIPPVAMNACRFYEFYELYYLSGLLFGIFTSFLTCCCLKGCFCCFCFGRKTKKEHID